MDPARSRLFQQIEAEFRSAVSLLPDGAHQSDPNLDIVHLIQEFLDHNELGLALHELEVTGQACGVKGPFWLHLHTAATLMGMTDKATSIAELTKDEI